MSSSTMVGKLQNLLPPEWKKGQRKRKKTIRLHAQLESLQQRELMTTLVDTAAAIEVELPNQATVNSNEVSAAQAAADNEESAQLALTTPTPTLKELDVVTGRAFAEAFATAMQGTSIYVNQDAEINWTLRASDKQIQRALDQIIEEKRAELIRSGDKGPFAEAFVTAMKDTSIYVDWDSELRWTMGAGEQTIAEALNTIIDEKAAELAQSGREEFAEAFVTAMTDTSIYVDWDSEIRWTMEADEQEITDALNTIINEKAAYLKQSGIEDFAKAMATAMKGTSAYTTWNAEVNWSRHVAMGATSGGSSASKHRARIDKLINQIISEKQKYLRNEAAKGFANVYARALKGTSHYASFSQELNWARGHAYKGDRSRLNSVLEDAFRQKRNYLRSTGIDQFSRSYAEMLRRTNQFASLKQEINWTKGRVRGGDTRRLQQVMDAAFRSIRRKSSSTIGHWYANAMNFTAGGSYWANYRWAKHQVSKGRHSRIFQDVHKHIWSQYRAINNGSVDGRNAVAKWHVEVMKAAGKTVSFNSSVSDIARGRFNSSIAQAQRNAIWGRYNALNRGTSKSRAAIGKWYADVMKATGNGNSKDAGWAAGRIAKWQFGSHVAKDVRAKLKTMLNHVGRGSVQGQKEIGKWYADVMKAAGNGNSGDAKWAAGSASGGKFKTNVGKSVRETLMQMRDNMDRGTIAGQRAIGKWYSDVMTATGNENEGHAKWAADSASGGNFRSNVGSDVREKLMQMFTDVDRGTVAGQQEIGQWYAKIMQATGNGQPGDASWAAGSSSGGNFEANVGSDVREKLMQFRSKEQALEGYVAAIINHPTSRGWAAELNWTKDKLNKENFKRLQEALEDCLMDMSQRSAADVGTWYSSVMDAAGQESSRHQGWATNRANSGSFWTHIAPSVRKEISDRLEAAGYAHGRLDNWQGGLLVDYDEHTEHLTVHGTNQDDEIEMAVAGSNISVSHTNVVSTVRYLLPAHFISELIVDGNAGDDTLRNQTHIASTLLGGADDDQLFGGTGNDVLRGGSGFDGLFGGGGTNELIGGSNADRFLLNFDQGDDSDDIISDEKTEDAVIQFINGDATTVLLGSNIGENNVSAGNWTDAEIQEVDGAFASLMSLTNNAELLETSADREMQFIRLGQVTNPSGVVNSSVGAWNDSGNTTLIDNTFSSWDVRVVVFHEIAHNWDSQSENRFFANAFRDVAGWEEFDSAPAKGHENATDNGWSDWYFDDRDKKLDGFARTYGKNNPLEDFATSMTAYVMAEIGENYFGESPTNVQSRLKDRFDVLDQFFQNLSS